VMAETYLAILVLSGTVVTIANVFILGDLRARDPRCFTSVGSPHWSYFLMGSWISFGPYLRALFARDVIYDRLKSSGARFYVVVIWLFFPAMVVAWIGLITTILT